MPKRAVSVALLFLLIGIGIFLAVSVLLSEAPANRDGEALVDEPPAQREPRPSASEPAELPPPLAAREKLPRLDLRVKLLDGATAGSGRDPDQAGRSALLSGAVSDASGGPLARAELRFVAGLNEGVETVCDAAGRYAFPALFPGLHLLRVSSAPGVMLRELRLPPESREFADFEFGIPAAVSGKVVDRKGKPVEGAKVEIDERVSWTDKAGVFFLGDVFPGNAVVYVTAEGHAAFRQNLSVPPGHRFEADKLQLALRPGGTLNGGVYPIGGTEPALLYLAPSVSTNDRSFPFERFSGIEAPGGGGFSIPNVPAGTSLVLLAYHLRSAAEPVSRPVLLRGRSENVVRLDFRFRSVRPIQGEVLGSLDGKPVAGARVRIFDPNPLPSISQVLKVVGPGMGSFFVPMLPFCQKEVRTDSRGKFFVESGDGPVRGGSVTLLVEAPGYLPFEKSFSGASVPEQRIVLYTTETLRGKASLELQFLPARSLEVALVLNGSPKQPRALAAGEPLRLEELPPGIYQVEASRDGARLFLEESLPLAGPRLLEIRLPE